MEFVQLDISAIRQSDSQNNAYVFLLNETDGKDNFLLLLVGVKRVQLLLHLDGTEKPDRPLTHDLFKTFGDSFDITVQKL